LLCQRTGHLTRKMLTRLVRAAPVRRQVLRNARSFASEAIDSDGKTEAELTAEINAALGDDADQLFFPTKAGEDAYNLEPVSRFELYERLATEAAEHGVDAVSSTQPTAPEPEGFLDAVGLGPFHRKASLIATGVLTALSNEFYVLNEETYVAACLTAGFTVMYVNLREPALEAYEAYRDEKLQAQQDAENKHIAACRTLINAQSGSSDIVGAVREVFAEKEELVHLEAQAKAIAEKNKVAKDFEGRLQALVNRKQNEENKAYKALVDKVYGDVVQHATSDKAFQKAALQYALTAISAPEKAGANPTVDMYRAKLAE